MGAWSCPYQAEIRQEQQVHHLYHRNEAVQPEYGTTVVSTWPLRSLVSFGYNVNGRVREIWVALIVR